MITSDEFSKQERELKNKVIDTIKERLKDVDDGKFELEPFEDEARNEVYAVDEAGVFFQGMMNDDETYPLGELGLLDAIYILGNME